MASKLVRSDKFDRKSMHTTYTQRDTQREPPEHKMEEFLSSKQNITGSCGQPEGRTQLLSNSSQGWMSHTLPTPTTVRHTEEILHWGFNRKAANEGLVFLCSPLAPFFASLQGDQ